MLSDVLKMLVMLSLLTLVNAAVFCDNAESYVSFKIESYFYSDVDIIK